jgi:hypothetical protein
VQQVVRVGEVVVDAERVRGRVQQERDGERRIEGDVIRSATAPPSDWDDQRWNRKQWQSVHHPFADEPADGREHGADGEHHQQQHFAADEPARDTPDACRRTYLRSRLYNGRHPASSV